MHACIDAFTHWSIFVFRQEDDGEQARLLKEAMERIASLETELKTKDKKAPAPGADGEGTAGVLPEEAEEAENEEDEPIMYPDGTKVT